MSSPWPDYESGSAGSSIPGPSSSGFPVGPNAGSTFPAPGEPTPAEGAAEWPGTTTRVQPDVGGAAFPAKADSAGPRRGPDAEALRQPVNPQRAHDEDLVSSPTQAVANPMTTPLLWLWVALALVVAALAVFFLLRSATGGVLGWVLGGPLAIGALAFGLVADAKARAATWFRPNPAADTLRRIVTVLALAAVALNSYHVAYDVSRGLWT